MLIAIRLPTTMALTSLITVWLISTTIEAIPGRFGDSKGECETNRDCPKLEECQYPPGNTLRPHIKRCNCKDGYLRSNYDVRNSPCIVNPEWCNDAKDCKSGQRCYFIDHRPCDGGYTQGCRNVTGRKGGCAVAVREVIGGARREPVLAQCKKNRDCGSKQICRIPDGDVPTDDRCCLCKEGYEVRNDKSGCKRDKDYCRSKKDCPKGQRCYRVDDRPCDGGVTNRCFDPGNEKGKGCAPWHPVEVGGSQKQCKRNKECGGRSTCRIPDGLVRPIKVCVCNEGYLRKSASGPCVDDKEWCDKRSDCPSDQRCYRLDDRPCDGGVRNRCFQPGEEEGELCGDATKIRRSSNGYKHECLSDRECPKRSTCRIGDGNVMPIKMCICVDGYRRNRKNGPCVVDKEWCDERKDCPKGKRCYRVDDGPCDGGYHQGCYKPGDRNAIGCGERTHNELT